MEHVGLIVYLWSIWDNIQGLLIISITLLLGITFLAFIFGFMEQDNAKYYKEYMNIKTIVVLLIIATLMPSKNSLLLVIASEPIAKQITQSYDNGKIKKINDLTDLALDKALKTLKDNK